jgi:hypothetical protein
VIVERNKFREESFFTGNYTPIRGTHGKIEGFYNAFFEVTSQKLLDRRKNMLNLLATPTTLGIDGVYSHIMASLATNPLDIPMAIIYEVDLDAEPGKMMMRVRGQHGIPKGHDLLGDGQYLEDTTGIMDLCRQATTGRVLIPLDKRFEGVEWLGFN